MIYYFYPIKYTLYTIPNGPHRILVAMILSSMLKRSRKSTHSTIAYFYVQRWGELLVGVLNVTYLYVQWWGELLVGVRCFERQPVQLVPTYRRLQHMFVKQPVCRVHHLRITNRVYFSFFIETPVVKFSAVFLLEQPLWNECILGSFKVRTPLVERLYFRKFLI